MLGKIMPVLESVGMDLQRERKFMAGQGLTGEVHLDKVWFAGSWQGGISGRVGPQVGAGDLIIRRP